MSWIELVAQRRPPQVPEGVTPPENAADWYRIENNAENIDETDVYVYDAIGGWMGTTADDFVNDLKGITSSRINLRLNSPGGSVFEGITIANAIRVHPANVTVYVDGLAASIASVIALAGDKLVMLPQSQMMIHDASGGCYGNAADMASMAELLDKQSDNIADAYADRAGGTAAEWRDLMRAETWYTAKEAVAAGLADELYTPPEKQDSSALAARMQSAWDLTAYRYAGRKEAPDPAPVAKATSGPIVMELDPTLPEDAIFDLVRRSIRLRNQAISPPEPTEEPPSDPPSDPPSEQPVDAALLAVLREAIRSELSPLLAALPPFLKPDEDEETEDAAEEEVEDETDPDEVEDAKTKKKKLPPWLKPDEDEEEAEDAATEEVEDEDADPPVKNTDDAFAGIVAQLTESPSPSADDIFNRLKEAL